MKKIYLFGVLGMVGCLMGAAVGEYFLKSAMPWANPSGSPESSVQSLVVPVQWRNRLVKQKERFSDPETEAAVMRSLRWLKANQKEDGSWDDRYKAGMTGLALLTFLAHGETPTSQEFGSTVQRGIGWLRTQAELGNGKLDVQSGKEEYQTGIATYALAEAYGMTQDASLRPVLEKCVDTIRNSQSNGGGWYYNYGSKSGKFGDLSISGWQIQALKSAYLAGIKQKEIAATLDRAVAYVKNVYMPYKGAADEGGFGYQSPECRWSLTGTGLLCLMFWHEGDSPEAKRAGKFLRAEVAFGIGKDPGEIAGKIGGPASRPGEYGYYAFYYITQAMFMFDGPSGPNWKYWNEQFNKALVKTQLKDGSFPAVDPLFRSPVYNTTLSALMLEVYYRNQAAPAPIAEQAASPWPMVIVVALWTALLAVGLSFLLTIGQNQYLGRPRFRSKQAAYLVFGGTVAGVVAGGTGQASLMWLGRMHPEIGQAIGWVLLGGLLGRGVAFYIPNLSGIRAMIAGALGGLGGVVGFFVLTQLMGATTGRMVGAAVLGGAIGMMVALVEVISREAWLEIGYGKGEKRMVSLGHDPVSIGSDQNACTVFVRDVVAVAYRYSMEQSRILCEDVASRKKTPVLPGDTRQLGKVTVTVCGSGVSSQATSVPSAAPQPSPAVAPQPSHTFSLRLSTGRSVQLRDELSLSASDVPGLDGQPSGSPLAVVARHPTDPAIQLLRNLSRTSWRVAVPGGNWIEVEPGKGCRLTAGIRINFGSVTGEITA